MSQLSNTVGAASQGAAPAACHTAAASPAFSAAPLLARQLAAYKPFCEQEAVDRDGMLAWIAARPGCLTRNDPVAHFTASAWLVDATRTKVLLVYHNIYKSWSWTGGHADGEEDLLRVALREVCEETGVQAHAVSNDIFSLETLTVEGHVKRGQYLSSHLHMNITYLMEADADAPLQIKPDENSGVRWANLDEAVALSTEPAMRVIYRKLNDRLRAEY